MAVMARMQHIVYATPRFFPDAGGVESHVFEVARRVAAAGWRVSVLTTDTEADEIDTARVDGVGILRVPARPRGRDHRVVPRMGRYLRALGPDILHVQSYHTAVAPQAMGWAARHRVPFILTFHAGGHSSPLRNAVRPVQQWALRPLLARARRLIVLSDWERDMYARRLRLPADHFVAIANGADLPLVPAGVATDPDLVVSIGRLERYKGHHRVLAAMPALLRARPAARLWIAGDGPYRDELTALAGRLGVAERVEIRAVPAGERARMAAELSQAGVVAMMSEYETQPIAALEALALGRRLVVADAPGLRQLADRGWAHRLPLDAPPAALAGAMADAMARGPQTRAFALPTWDDCADQLVRLYRGVLEGTA